jgi:hypothetical protein
VDEWQFIRIRPTTNLPPTNSIHKYCLLFRTGECVSRCQSVDPSFRYNHFTKIKLHFIVYQSRAFRANPPCLWGQSTTRLGGESSIPVWGEFTRYPVDRVHWRTDKSQLCWLSVLNECAVICLMNLHGTHGDIHMALHLCIVLHVRMFAASELGFFWKCSLSSSQIREQTETRQCKEKCLKINWDDMWMHIWISY